MQSFSFRCGRAPDEGELGPKMVWRVKLVAELEPGLTTEVKIARLEYRGS